MHQKVVVMLCQETLHGQVPHSTRSNDVNVNELTFPIQMRFFYFSSL